ncbi:hypothetical protein K469DRAFT_744670 [Zopfia rhizophila CBS 207.26]|uniref:Polyketide synthase n=1 Tax=Zopfia rhizophila CBS 207.26 TaxID=1314779 RepID=A0A6A6EVH1_9PEZI|nr:hypothetical protein K469DRAFT_744670 [Zopfia rhizophila CBS 207.26]
MNLRITFASEKAPCLDRPAPKASPNGPPSLALNSGISVLSPAQSQLNNPIMRTKMVPEPIAIVGSAHRFPGDANSPSKLWTLLSSPKDVQSLIPTHRFSATGFYHPDGTHHGTSNVQHSYLLSEDPRAFDASFFGIKPAEANAIDPQQRLLLETTYESLEAAGITVDQLKGSDTAVYIGLMCTDYTDLLMRDPESIPTYTGTGTAASIMSNRISHFFNWHGPSMTIDTACSSSLVAVHQAVQTLRAGTSRVAIAGGSNLLLGPEMYIAESKLAMLSPTGRSRMWDASADGYARGDGVAAVVLKTLSAALADGDYIECIIRETGVNQDGRTPRITMPSAAAQKKLILETRGPLPILRGSWDWHSSGSIKTVIGHTEGTAGLAGLLKASLALQAGKVPPNLLFNSLSAKVAPFYNNLQIVTGEAVPWPETVDGAPRRASVNSFGFGGTNAHAILESYEATSPSANLDKRRTINTLPLVFTAKSEQSLVNTLEAYSTYLQENPEANIRNLAWTLNFRRTQFPMRTTLSAVNISSLQDAIQQKLKAIRNKEADAFSTVSNINNSSKMKKKKKAKKSTMQQQSKPTLAVFTGQGAQWSGMMRELVRSSPFVQGRLRSLEQCLSRLPKEDRPSWSLVRELTEGSNRVKEAALSQPLCTALQIVMVDILRAAAVKLDAVVGHSSGEMAAAYAAGFLSAEDAIVISYYRGLHSRLAGGGEDGSIKGGMLAVGISSEDAADLVSIPELQGRVVVAACNSNSSFTLSGDRDAIELARDILADEGKFARMLQVDKAYHSPHMPKCSDAYLTAIRKCDIKVQSPPPSEHQQRPVWYSSVDEVVMTGQRRDLADTYWNDNLTKPVLFSQALESATAASGPFGVAIEIRPHAALKGPVAQHDVEALADCMGFLGTAGLNLDLDALDKVLNGVDAPPPQLLKSLPAYGWNHQHSYWHESRISRSYRTRAPTHPLLGTRVNDGADQEFRWRNFLSPAELPWLTGHSIQGQLVFPAAAYISTCVEAARAMSGDNEIRLVELIDVVLGQALVFKDETSKVEILFSITGIEHNHQGEGEDSLTANFVLYSAANPDSDTLSANASGKLRIVYGTAAAEVLPPRSPDPLDLVAVPEDRFYTVLKDSGYGYTGPFRALHQLRRKLGHTLGLARYASYTSVQGGGMESNTGMARVAIDPAMLDATVQSIILAKSWPGDGRLWSMHVPQRIDRVSINLSFWGRLETVACDHYASSYSQPISGILGDIRIFAGNESESDISQSHAMIQMEGVLAVPLDPATPDNDRIMFSQLVWGYAEPNAELIAYDGRASNDDYDLAYVLERVAHYYLGQLERAFDDHHPARKQGPYVGLLRYARHVTSRPPLGMAQGQLPDAEESILRESARFPTNIDLQMMHLIGRHLGAVVRGEANMIEYLTADKLLDRYYEQAMSISIYTTYMARVVASITHRFPHMHILEVGAGTGGATKHIMKAVQGVFRSYTFTDVSSGFFENARSLFSRQGNGDGIGSGRGGDKMTFKVLDLEKDVTNQGFAPESCDLIIASLVLHATTNLKATMENVRQLLKPGGYLVMLEVTNLEQARLGFIFGSLPGWWLGASDGRVLSPCLPKDGWDAVLRRSGFSGVDSSTPDLDALPYPLSVIVTQAVDKEIQFLRDPLAAPYDILIPGSDKAPAMHDLVLVGGRSKSEFKTNSSEIDAGAEATDPAVVTNLEKLLSNHAGSISHYPTLQHLKNAYDAGDVPAGAVTVFLTDLLDEPVFKALTQGDLDGLRAMYKQSRAVLWIAQGARNSNPHHSQSLGFVRSMQLEMSHVRSQFLDLGNTAASLFPRVIAEHLLRFAVLDAQEQEQQGQAEDLPLDVPRAQAEAQAPSVRHAMWSIEPELAIEDGILRVPRIRPCRDRNDRYNAARRIVTEQVNPLHNSVQLVQGTRGYMLQKSPAAKSNGHVGDVTIEVCYSMLTPVPVGTSNDSIHEHSQRQFLVSGRLSGTPYTAVAMSNYNASIIRVPKDCVALCTEAVDPVILRQAHYHATLATVMSTADSLVVILDPEPDMLLSLKTRLDSQGVRVLVLSSGQSSEMNTRIALLNIQSRLINKHCTRAELLASLPPGMSLFLDASAESHSGLGDRIVQCLPSECRTYRYRHNNAPQDQSPVSGSSSATASSELSASQLRSFVDAARQEVSSYAVRTLPLPPPSLHAFTEMQDLKKPVRVGAVIDWTMAPDQSCSVNIQPVHAQVHLRGDRTYWLVGLTGSLGISLCRWMIRQGARTIVVTSRKPNVDARVLAELATSKPGVTVMIKLLAADVTSMSSLAALRQHMARSLPPIAGVAQGAMVLQDSTLADMTLDQFNSVLAPKVDGSKNLDALFQNDEDKLDFFVMFSSAVGVTGNIGQSNYSAANMFMTGLAANRRKRGLAGSTINIGVILGVGYVTRETSQSLQDNLARSGHSWMSEEDFHTLFAEGVLAGSPELNQKPDLNSGLRIVGASDAQRPSWSFSPKFQHLIRHVDSADADATTTNKARVSIRLQLATASTAQVAMEMLTEAFVAKLGVMLQLPESKNENSPSSNSIVDLRAEDIGIDSLNAVELRSWILKQLKVDVPVLRILGGSTLRELLDFILDNIPAQLVPLLEAERRVVHHSISHTRTEPAEVQSEQRQHVPDEDSEVEATENPVVQMPHNDGNELNSDDEESDSDEESDDDEETRSSRGTESFTMVTNEEVTAQKVVSINSSNSTSDRRSNGGSNAVEEGEIEQQQQQQQQQQREQKSDYQRLVPMSFAQSRFWFLKHYIEDPTTFNVTVMLEVIGTLRQRDLELAVLAVGQRHEALRTCLFQDEHEQPMQGVLATSPLRLETKTYSSEAELQMETQMVRDNVYDIEHGRVMRIVLLSAATNGSPSYLVVGYHHINMDGISFQLLLNDLSQAYGHKPLAQKVLQYPDHAIRQRSQQASGAWDEDLAYWRQEFVSQPLPPVLPLLPVASARQRHALTRYEDHKATFRVPKPLAAKIRALGKQSKTSPYHLYLTTLLVLLARLSRTSTSASTTSAHSASASASESASDSDICIGLADAGRVDADAATGVGLYLNLLPVRLRYAPEQTLIEAVRTTRSRVYAATAHSRPPLDVVLSELAVERSASHSPLFQVLVDYRQSIEERQAFGGGPAAGGCVLQGHKYDVGRTAYDVALDVTDNANGEALLVIGVQAGLYELYAAEALMSCYTTLLEQFCKNPEARLDEARIFSEAHISKALVAGRGEMTASTWEPTLVHQVERMAQLYPNNLAIKDASGNTMTYKTMISRVLRISTALEALNLKALAGSRIGVFQDTTADWICSMLAIMRVGGVYVPMDLKVGIQRLAMAVKDCQPAVILFDASTRAQLPELLGLAVLEPLTINVGDIGVSPYPGSSLASIKTGGNVALPAAPAVVLYTSGSTGVPKGTVLKHEGILANIEGNTREFQIGPSDIGLQQIALSFDFSVWQIFMCLANGAGLVMAPKSARGDAKALTELIVAEGITFTGATPSEYISWLRYGDKAALRSSEWTCAVSSGEQMTDTMKRLVATLAKLDLKLFNGYGPTEGSFSTAKLRVDYLDERVASCPYTPGGYTQPNYTIYILDGDLQPLPCGFEGQIAIGGAGVGLGYLNNDDMTAQRFVPDPFVKRATHTYLKQQGWAAMHLTGDCGVLRPDDGALLVRGRVSGDTQTKLRGLRIDLRDIEVAIIKAAANDSEGPIVNDAVVSVRTAAASTDEQQKEGAEFLVAHIVFAPHVSQSERERVLDALPRSLPLPQFMVPSVFVPLERLHLNAHLKLDRRAVAALPLPQASEKRIVRLNSELSAVEAKLAHMWESVIPAEIRGDHFVSSKTSDFFAVGGDSLLLLKLREEISRSFGVDLPLVQLFEASSLESMAARIQAIVGVGPISAPTTPDLEKQEQAQVQPRHVADDMILKGDMTTAGGTIDWDLETDIKLDKIDEIETSPYPPRWRQSITRPNSNSIRETVTVVLTGATGFLGKALLQALLQDTRVARIHCIAVRRPDSHTDPIFKDAKVLLHEGDLGQPMLGLSPSGAESIFGQAQDVIIIHNGADVSFLKPYAALRRTNVGSTSELVRMATRHRRAVAAIHYVSTAGVAQFTGRASVGEESVANTKPSTATMGAMIGAGYAASKWASEVLLEKASHATGLPVTVHRPTNVTGGAAPTSDVMQSILHYSRVVGAVPVSDVWDPASGGQLDFVMVETVAEGVVRAALDGVFADPTAVTAPQDTHSLASSGSESTPLRFAHYLGEVQVPLHAVGQFLQKQTGRPLRAVPLTVWVVEAEMAGLDPLVAEVLVEAERSGVKISFPRLVKGYIKNLDQGLQNKQQGWGVFTPIFRTASKVSNIFGLA